ncbi:MAG: hypothetical protein JRE40_15955 [Deltaproteobacteria bacterium]|nr:hypothetical protein [Deltaproteobacteria bacterium]
MDKMLGELIKDEQEREKKEAQKTKEKAEADAALETASEKIPPGTVFKKSPSRKKKGKKA